MAGEAASLTDMRNTMPARQEAHRTAVAVVDVGTPAATSFAVNHGWWPRCRLYLAVALAGGTNPALALRVWCRKRPFGDEANTEQLGILMAPCGDAGQAAVKPFIITGLTAGSYVVDVPVNGDDIFVEVTGAMGAPTSFSFSCALGWRA